MRKPADIFGRDRAVIGMIHVHALPGTPAAALSLEAVVEKAVEEARTLRECGLDCLLIENMHDRPYLRRRVGPEIVAAMTRVALAVRHEVNLPLGVQILAGANHEALAVAHASGGAFIRAEGFVFASVADEGLLDEADAGPLLRYRRAIGAESVAILADIKKKHSAHAVTADVSITQTAAAAEFFCADGVIVTGPATGQPVDEKELGAVRAATTLPVLVGSGASPERLGALFRHADAVIVGSALKEDGRWDRPIDPARASKFMETADAARR